MKTEFEIPLLARLIPSAMLLAWLIYVYFFTQTFTGTWGDVNAILFILLNIPLIAILRIIAKQKTYSISSLTGILLLLAVLVFILYGGGISYVADLIRYIHRNFF